MYIISCWYLVCLLAVSTFVPFVCRLLLWEMERSANQSSYLSTPRNDHMSKPLASIPPYSSPRTKGKYTMSKVSSDLIQTFKIINRIDKVDKSLFFEIDSVGRRGHSNKLFKKRCRLDIRKYAFSNRTVDKWNSLTQDCINCTTINAFKCHIPVQKFLEPETK